MRIWNAWTTNSSSTVGKIVMALVFASAIGGIFIAPAFAADKDRREGYHEQGRDEHGRDGRGRRVYQSPRRYYYSAPVYAPPPVVYTPAPYQSPGISLFFPIQIR